MKKNKRKSKPKPEKKKLDTIPEVKNPVGKPPVFSSPEEMQKQIEDYLHNCPDVLTIVTKDGDKIELPKLTSSGLAYHIGFASRQSLYDYAKKDEYSYTIKRAMLFIEKEYEMKLGTGNAAGIIFALKNFGWKDQTEIVQKTEADLSDLTDDELDEQIQKLET
jgi:hypothetical protein